MDRIIDLVVKGQSGDNECIYNIIERFNPLIKKYSRKLNYDGADSDLTICLIETIKRIPIGKALIFSEDKYVIGYIHTAIKHKYIQLSKKNFNMVYGETELDLDIFSDIKSKNNEERIDDQIFISNLINKLPSKQRQIIGGIFFHDFSEAELSIKLQISRQAINRTKNRALNNLKKLAIEQ